MKILQCIQRLSRRALAVARVGDPYATIDKLRMCRFETMEERQYLAADVHLGAVYFEDATGDDSQGDTIQITFEGGEAGTELTHVVIDTDKNHDGPTTGDLIFDTAPGGAGAFGSSPLQIISSNGFQVLNFHVVDGGTRITFDLAGFKAGMKLVFTIDTDEIQFTDSQGNHDVNAIVEGGEFQRSNVSGTFVAPNFFDATVNATFWDAYDANFAAEQAAAGTMLNLPPDRYADTGDFIDRTAGAVGSVKQVPMPITLSGIVFEDRNLSNSQQAGEPGIAGVVLSLQVWNGSNYVATGKTSVTDANGAYKFESLTAGKYRIVEAQPTGYFSVGASAGNVGGQVRGVVSSGDMLSEITLVGGDASVHNDFAEARPTSISGHVHADVDGDCVFDPEEQGIADVVIQLLDKNGNILQVTKTDVNGNYKFNNLAPGEYQIRELQPTGYFDSGDHPGSAGGVVLVNDTISQISLPSGTDAVDYNFCEIPPASLAGYVYHDANKNGVRDAGEQGIAGVALILKDSAGNPTGKTAVTGADGSYRFDNLAPGTYTVAEVQPSGWLDGADSAGSAGGTAQNPGDQIVGALLTPGISAVNYNFGELKPTSISGHVHADVDGDCVFDPEEHGIAGVVIRLFNGFGSLVATTTTDANGNYQFTGLPPGMYTVHEEQPEGYFDSGDHPGSAGGVVSQNDTISEIVLNSGQQGINYNFCERPPASISGYVFQDGGPISTGAGQSPNVPAVRDGKLTSDDLRLPGVVLELRDGVTGLPIYGSQALGSKYPPDQIITAVTDANGYYEFTGLPTGNYAVYERQDVAGLIDGINTAGSTGGIVVSAYTSVDQGILDQLLEQPASGDAILQIVVGAGQSSAQNNFSEVATETPFFFNPPPPVQPQSFIQNGVGSPEFAALNPVVRPLEVPRLLYGGSLMNYTWHLSVIDAGNPRGVAVQESAIRDVAADANELTPFAARMKKLRWTFVDKATADKSLAKSHISFGMVDGVPITGDFNGDGTTEVGVFKDGEWFIDLNGSGEWDEGDLWAKLGKRDDRPVTGDWNGDGKTDIGIFGPAWPRDPHAIRKEPGIPDPDNKQLDAQKNLPPRPEDAAIGARSLKLRSQAKPRADLIDHVFHYGVPDDVPVTGDWNGDGIETIGIFHGGKWYRDTDGDGRFSLADKVANFGNADDKPVVGDWNGDGCDELGVYRGGKWYLDTNGNDRLDAADTVLQLGGPHDQPVVGDWDGDGVDEPGIVQNGQVLHGERITSMLRKTQ